MLLKAACKGKKDIKTFTLSNVDTTTITSSHRLKDLIKESLHDDISSGNFDVGYMQGTMLSSSTPKIIYQKCDQISEGKGAAQIYGVMTLLNLEVSAANPI